MSKEQATAYNLVQRKVLERGSVASAEKIHGGYRMIALGVSKPIREGQISF